MGFYTERDAHPYPHPNPGPNPHPNLHPHQIGFYTELDFKNEAANMDKMRTLFEEQGITDVAVPKVYLG